MRLFHNYVPPPAGDLQQLLIQELYGPKQVNEPDVDQLHNGTHRISECYIRAGAGSMAETLLVVAMERNLQINSSMDLIMEFLKVCAVDQILNAINK